MGMFDGFNSNNLSSPLPEDSTEILQSSAPKKPYEDYNAEGELIGYWWYEGDSVDIRFDIDGEVTFDDSYVTAEDFLADKFITIQLYNFRREEIDARNYAGTTTVVYEINKEQALELPRSIYYIKMSIWDENNFNKTIFYQDDTRLTIK